MLEILKPGVGLVESSLIWSSAEDIKGREHGLNSSHRGLSESGEQNAMTCPFGHAI